ncbi:MAG TPA: hypothetical protein DCE44_13645 [Verrucomicrobiales bacterium]|nr:hypothetical protein [Verrucomicrobiales bacterium]
MWLRSDGSEYQRAGFHGQPTWGAGESFWDAKPRANGGYLLTGGSSTKSGDDKSSPHYGALDGWVVAVDAHGAKEWDRSYGGVDQDLLQWGFELPDKTLVFAGYTQSTGHGSTVPSPSGLYYQWIIATDEFGTIKWQQRLLGLMFSCIRTRKHDFILGSQSMLTKVNGDGTIAWSRDLRGPQYVIVSSIAEIGDSRILAAVESTDSVHPAYRDLRCFDESGNLLWQTAREPGFLPTTGPLIYVDNQDSTILAISLEDRQFRLTKMAGDTVSPWSEGVACFALPEFRPESYGGNVFTLVGQSGKQYVIERSPNLSNWTPYSTNVVGSQDVKFIAPPRALGDQSFFRAVLVGED